tara:strand:- start:4635 stop:4820 length:186 start_codon:yes stop_codon:yes gene_type:complete
MNKQKLTKKQSELLGAAMVEATSAPLSYQEILTILEQKFGVVANKKAFQRGLDQTAEKYNS